MDLCRRSQSRPEPFGAAVEHPPQNARPFGEKLFAQRLIPREAGKGRIAAMEVMLNTPLIADLIFRGEVSAIKEIMAKSNRLGMKTFDQALYELFEAGVISYEEALRNADSKNEIRLRMKKTPRPEIDKKVFEKMMQDRKAFVMPKMEGRNWVLTTPGEKGQADREAKIRQRIEEMRKRSGVKADSEFKFEVPSVRAPLQNRAFALESKRMRIKELLESLSPEQREMQEKNGFLTLGDLTPKQREMLGDTPKEGNWTFSYSIGDKRVTIKNK